MAKYKIIPSSRTIVQSPISIGHKAEKGVEAIEFDLTAWVETYGSGTLTVIMRRWGDAIPYPIALEIDENNKATWTLSDTDTAKAGMAYAQLNYIVGDEVVKKSDIYTFRVMDSLTGEGEPPEAYESWLEHLTHIAAEAMAEVLDIEGIVTDKTLTVDGGIADAKATGEALAEKVDAADYSTLSARVGANTIALAEKADRSTTYTKAQVDQMISDVEVETDTTLSVSGAPADAKATGDALSALEDQFNKETDQLKADLDAIEPGLSAAAKAALLNCFDHVAWEDDSGREYYNSLERALYENVYPKITAIFNPGAHTVYTDDSLESLKPYLNVKYYEDSASEGTTVSSYTLSGTLEEGTSIITVLYQGLHTGVSINNIVDFYSIHEWSMSNGLLKAHVGTVQTDSTRGMIIAEGAADRRTVGVSHGVVPYYGTVTADWLDIYPIPVPMNAKKCTLTITPSKSLISRGFRIISNGKYKSSISWVTYTQGPIVIDLPEMSEQHYMQIVTQYETGSSSYPEEIEEFTVSYSDEE